MRKLKAVWTAEQEEDQKRWEIAAARWTAYLMFYDKELFGQELMSSSELNLINLNDCKELRKYYGRNIDGKK